MKPALQVYPTVYGSLQLGAGYDHNLSWQVQQPFRPEALVLFGATLKTWVHSFRVGFNEQIVEPFPFLHLFSRPTFTLADLLESCVEPLPDGVAMRRLEGVRLKARPQLAVWPPMHTASPGMFLTLKVRGPLDHAVVYGVSVD